MKTEYAILTVALTISLSGCVIGAKPAVTTPPAPQPVAVAPVPPPPPQQLSMPQTQVQLPPDQPIDPDALTPAPTAEVHTEAPPPARPNRARQQAKPVAPPPATVEPAAPPATPPAPPAAAPENERGRVQELLAPAERDRLKNSADTKKHDVRAWLSSSRGRKIDKSNPTLARIVAMLQASDEAEEKGDMREASDLADRAVTALRELQSGR